MKNIFTLSVFVFAFGFWGKAQITLDSTNMPYVGWSEIFAKDTPLTSVNYGSAGANQVYDFHTLAHTKSDTAVYSAPTSGQITNYPHANMMVTADHINYVAARNAAYTFDAEGLQTTLSGTVVYTKFSPVDTTLSFTTQYQGNYKGNWGFREAVTGSMVGQPSVDSVIVTSTDYYWDTIDGWGTIKTPIGTYNGLREARKDSTHTTVIATGVPIVGTYTVEDYSAVTLEYQYLAKETKGDVVKFDYDSVGDLLDAQYSLIPPSPIAHFTFVTGASGLVTFTDSSSNSPASYYWTFGDGDTSNLKSPTHTYTNDGTYYVCETVTNVSGTSTYCDSVHITNAPGPVAHFTWAAAGGGLIDFTDASTGSPTSYSWTFGDGGTANTADPSHTYTANGAYYVCETVSNVNGSSTYCDSVHVTGISASHQAPVAAGDTSSVIKPNRDTVNVTANDYSPSGDAFCITSVSNTAYFTVYGCNDVVFNSTNATAPGLDSTWYVVCNTNQPTLCDSALLIVTVEKAHVPPVAVNVYDTVTEVNNDTTNDTINVTVNDYSPSGDTFCIDGGYGPGNFFPINCNEVTFTPDSGFTGKDTAWYIICNNNQPTLCDTAEIIVTVEPAIPCHLTDSIINIICAGNQSSSSYYYCGDGFSSLTPYFSSHVDSFSWTLSSITGSPLDTVLYNLDTITIGLADSYGGSANVFIDMNGLFGLYHLCLTAYNSCGTTTFCDTISLWTEGINDLTLSNISIYPNPTSNILTIDMLHNTDAITNNYTAIQIYNAIGQQVISQPRNNQSKLVNIPVTDLPEGVYLATIVDSQGVRRTLGKFTVAR